MEKILLEYDRLNHQKLEVLLNGDLKHFQQLFNVVKANFKDFDGSLFTLEDIIHNAPMFFLDQLVSEKDLNFNGLPISKTKALEMVDFPQEFKQIIEAAKKFKADFKESHTVNDDIYDALSIVDIDANGGTLKIKDSRLLSLKDEFCRYTRNENQNVAVHAINTIIEQIEVLKKLGLHARDLTFEAIGINVSGEKPRLDRYKIYKVK